MKNKNQRELEKHWAEQQKKAAKTAAAATKKNSDVKPADEQAVKGKTAS